MEIKNNKTSLDDVLDMAYLNLESNILNIIGLLGFDESVALNKLKSDKALKYDFDSYLKRIIADSCFANSVIRQRKSIIESEEV